MNDNVFHVFPYASHTFTVPTSTRPYGKEVGELLVETQERFDGVMGVEPISDWTRPQRIFQELAKNVSLSEFLEREKLQKSHPRSFSPPRRHVTQSDNMASRKQLSSEVAPPSTLLAPPPTVASIPQPPSVGSSPAQPPSSSVTSMPPPPTYLNTRPAVPSSPSMSTQPRIAAGDPMLARLLNFPNQPYVHQLPVLISYLVLLQILLTIVIHYLMDRWI